MTTLHLGADPEILHGRCLIIVAPPLLYTQIRTVLTLEYVQLKRYVFECTVREELGGGPAWLLIAIEG